MKIEIILLIIISIGFILTLIYFIGYNKISIIKTKMDCADEIITKSLKEKYTLMKQIYDNYKKIDNKKDYLKDFNNLKIKKLPNYELDIELNNYYKIMQDLKDDNKKLDTKDNNELFSKISLLNETLMANKKYFNKNNTILNKSIKGYIKIIAKINNIKMLPSYEIK